MAHAFQSELENLIAILIRGRYSSQMEFWSSLLTPSFLAQNDVMGPPPPLTVRKPKIKLELSDSHRDSMSA